MHYEWISVFGWTEVNLFIVYSFQDTSADYVSDSMSCMCVDSDGFQGMWEAQWIHALLTWFHLSRLGLICYSLSCYKVECTKINGGTTV